MGFFDKLIAGTPLERTPEAPLNVFKQPIRTDL